METVNKGLCFRLFKQSSIMGGGRFPIELLFLSKKAQALIKIIKIKKLFRVKLAC